MQQLENVLQRCGNRCEKYIGPDSPSCNVSSNKNIARLYDCEACYALQFRLKLVLQEKCEISWIE